MKSDEPPPSYTIAHLGQSAQQNPSATAGGLPSLQRPPLGYAPLKNEHHQERPELLLVHQQPAGGGGGAPINDWSTPALAEPVNGGADAGGDARLIIVNNSDGGRYKSNGNCCWGCFKGCVGCVGCACCTVLGILAAVALALGIYFLVTLYVLEPRSRIVIDDRGISARIPMDRIF